MDELAAKSESGMTFTMSALDGTTTVVTISGELDLANVDRLEAAVAPLLTEGRGRLVLDLRDLRFADSSAIALWVRWATAVDELRLRDVPPLLLRVIETMGLAEKLQLEP